MVSCVPRGGRHAPVWAPPPPSSRDARVHKHDREVVVPRDACGDASIAHSLRVRASASRGGVAVGRRRRFGRRERAECTRWARLGRVRPARDPRRAPHTARAPWESGVGRRTPPASGKVPAAPRRARANRPAARRRAARGRRARRCAAATARPRLFTAWRPPASLAQHRFSSVPARGQNGCARHAPGRIGCAQASQARRRVRWVPSPTGRGGRRRPSGEKRPKRPTSAVCPSNLDKSRQESPLRQSNRPRSTHETPLLQQSRQTHNLKD